MNKSPRCIQHLHRMPPARFVAYAGPAVVAASGLLPTEASAHVKWFAPYDIAASPVPIAGVLTPEFVLVLAGFTLLMFAGFVFDRLAARSGWIFPALGSGEDLEEGLLRAAIGGFFVALFTMGGVILTPELKSSVEWTEWLQFAIAASMVSRRTCILGALGILALYGYGVLQYGAFHLSDYPIFLGIAAYMALTSCASVRLRSLRMPILYVALCVSLMWGSVEKWAYPQWSFPLLETRPYLTQGVPPGEFMMVAGFVEFALAFYILTGLGLLRLGILALGLIFVAAIVDFGKLDAIGHLPVIASLAAMFLHGPTRLHHWLHDVRRGLLTEAHGAGIAYATAIGIFFAAYYGLQYVKYSTDAEPQRLARFNLAGPTR